MITLCIPCISLFLMKFCYAIHFTLIDFEVYFLYSLEMTVYFLRIILVLGIFIILWCHIDLGQYLVKLSFASLSDLCFLCMYSWVCIVLYISHVKLYPNSFILFYCFSEKGGVGGYLYLSKMNCWYLLEFP